MKIVDTGFCPLFFLTLSRWLRDLAVANDVKMAQVLQHALRDVLGIEQVAQQDICLEQQHYFLISLLNLSIAYTSNLSFQTRQMMEELKKGDEREIK